ncbi:MAG TPA: ATP-binding protein [Polyangiaceae bacterium]|nr:ATP-binding protein [Polyangiaceae bacterium]
MFAVSGGRDTPTGGGLSFLEGGGELGALMRSYDWTTTPLGPPSLWPRSLKTAVRIMLTSRQPFWLGWGPELTYLYNDPYKSIIGGKHPRALGRPFREVWSEIWDVIGPMAETVMTRDEGTYVEAQMLIMERHGYQEETYYTFSYSPIPGDDGGTAGLICANTDDTGRVIGERQLETLRQLSVRAADARSAEAACALSVEALTENARDLPFVLLYLTDANADALVLTASTPGAASLSQVAWPSARALFDNHAELVAIPASAGDVPTGAWPRPPSTAIVLPLPPAGTTGRAGVLVAGLNPFRQLDAGYRSFLDLVAHQVAGNIANAEAYAMERKRSEALLALDRAKTEFFSNVSHEFRTPLTLMLGPLEDTLRESEALLPDDRARLDLAHRNARRLLKLVNTLLDFSRLEAGHEGDSFEPVDLGVLTGELASVFRSAIERAGLSLTVHAPSPSAPVYVDRDMWEKVVFNLLSNALKFTFEGGIAVTLAERGPGVDLSISDTGTGIPATDLPHVFERFHRVKGARGRTIEGSGIGLALVRELVKLHGGNLTVESELGRGTTFRVWLPFGRAHLPAERLVVARAVSPTPPTKNAYVTEALGWVDGAAAEFDADAEAPTEAAARPAGARLRILLCEDNADMRDYVTRLLGSTYDVESVNDGEQALNAVRRRIPDLVLSDVMVPKLDGLGLLAALRAETRLEAIPVILLSARAGESARVEGLRLGADDYLVKPFSARELLTRIAALIERRRVERTIREHAESLEILNRVGVSLAAELDLERILQTVTDAATAVSGAQFGAFFYNVTNELGEAYLLYTLSGAPREAFEGFGTPRNTPIFAPTFRGEGPVRLADVTRDPRYGTLPPHHGMPKGHLPVRSYLAVPVTARSGEVIGGLFFGHSDVGVFTERAERIVTGIASQASVAIDSARLYEQHARLIDELRESDRRKGEFIATLSHELRNPLAPLRNALHALHLLGPPNPSAGRLREMIERQVGHLVRLVDDLLEVSRINRGTFELRRERVELADVVQSALETTEPLYAAGARHLDVQLPEESLVLDGDPVRLTQILGNLLNNAAKYTNNGGHVWLATRREGDSVVVTVRDDGIGIAPESLPGLFEMFYRGSGAGSRGGLGIGLTLAQKLAEMHGGTITASSGGLDQGSEFTVRLPLAPGIPMSSSERTMTPLPLGRRRVLVTDDNVDAAEALGVLLEILGAEVRVVHDGTSALTTFADYAPDLVLLDIGMPGMDGYEVARRIRAQEGEHHTKLVALTGWGQAEDSRRAKEAGFDQHIVKPADMDVVKALLASVEPAARE